MLKYISNNSSLIKYLIFGVLIFLLLRQCNQTQKLKTEIKQVETVSNRTLNNYKASQDTIQIERNRMGELVSSVRSFELEVNNLSNENKKLLEGFQDALNINQKLKNINNTLSTNLEIKDSLLDASTKITYQTQDSIQIEINDQKKWNKYNWRQLNANLTLNRTDSLFKITDSNFLLQQGLSLKAAIVKIENRKELRISTPYPGVKFTNIENINLVNDKLNPALQKPKNWGIGVGIQYGLNLNNNQIISTGPSIGIGLYYTPSWLRF